MNSNVKIGSDKMSKPTPIDVFADPSKHWPFLTAPSDDEFEDDHFDRKEAGHIGTDGRASRNQVHNVIDLVTECISAFANSNIEGGLLVLGIARNGSVKGVNHLEEAQRNCILNFDTLLVNQSAQAKLYDCKDKNEVANQILLIFTPYTERAICETPGPNPKTWTRSGPQNIPVSQAKRDWLRQHKRIVDFENTFLCDFNLADVDQQVLSAFRRVFLSDDTRQMNDEELLLKTGALIRTDKGLAFTNAGVLFFASNPQRFFACAHIRLLRFNAKSEDRNNRGLPTLDKPFTGPITKQIRDALRSCRRSPLKNS